MAREIIIIGQLPNDGTGDPLRTAFNKINNNFAQLYDTTAPAGPVGSLQFNFQDSANANAKLMGSEALVLDVNAQTLNVGANLIPTSAGMSIGNATNRVGNMFLGASALHVGNTAVSESGNVLTFGVSANSQTLSSIAVSEVRAKDGVLYGNAAQVVMDTLVAYTDGNTPGQELVRIPAGNFRTGIFNIKSTQDNLLINQSITITVNKSPGIGGVNHVQHGTVFNGGAVTRYDVLLNNGDVVVVANPLITTTATHTISYQITTNPSTGTAIPVIA